MHPRGKITRLICCSAPTRSSHSGSVRSRARFVELKVSLNEGQSQVVTSSFSTDDSGPLNVFINGMAGTGKSIATILLRLVLPDDCVTVMAAVASSVVERILDVVHVGVPHLCPRPRSTPSRARKI